MSSFWKTALLLWLLALAGIACMLPYVVTLEGKVLAEAVARTHMPLALLLALSIGQSAVLFAVAVVVGLWASRRVGLSCPLVHAAVTRTALPPGTGRTLALALGIGVATGLALMVIDHFVFAPIPSVAALLDASESTRTKPSAWMGLLASLYGGFDEEILMRLGLLSLFILLLRNWMPPSLAFWVANLVASVLFGLGHLPATAALAPLSTALVVRALLLNGAVGVIAGVLFRRFGLEWGMASHFGFDLVAHVLL
jgi:hypothetical protein